MKNAHLILASLLVAAYPGARAAQADTPQEPVFLVNHYEVSGNTLLQPEALDAALAPFRGEGRRFADVEAARQALQGVYVSRGYSTVSVSLPEQEISGGRVLLVVQESRLGEVKLLGALHHDTANLRASLPGLVEGQVPNTVRVAESLRLANENPAKQTQMVFRSGKQDGTTDALIRVEDAPPQKVFISLDDTGNAQTGKARLGVGWQHANLLNRDQVFTAHYVTSPTQPDDVALFGLGYHIPLYASADAIDLHAGYSNVDSGTVSDVFKVSGKGTLFGARYTLNLRKRSPVEHRLAFAFDYRAFENNVDHLGTPVGNDVTVHPISLGYLGKWEGRNAQAGFQVNFNQNLPGGSHGRSADFALARTGAKAGYRLLRLGSNLRYRLGSDWQLGASLDGQYTWEPLISGEQFGLGGRASVRGFSDRVVNGDSGWRAGVELSGPDIGARLGLDGAHLRLLGFLEGGEVFLHEPQAGDMPRAGIASVGLGMNFAWGPAFNARLDYGHVIDGDGTKNPGSGRFHLGLSWVF